MDDGGEAGSIGTGSIKRREHAKGLVLHRGRHLGELDLAGHVIDQDQVGEGAAYVDACDAAHCGSVSGADSRAQLLREPSKHNVVFAHEIVS